MPPANPATDPFLSTTFQEIPSRTLLSDSLEYQLYALSPSLPTPEARLAELESVHQTCLQLRQEWCEGYIFHRGAPPTFNLPSSVTGSTDSSVSSPRSPSAPYPAITGRLEYGDAVDDEWFTLSLMLAISRRHPTVYLLPTDTSDGLFLFVEAAHALPRWLEQPETAENRVWINQGRLYIIPGKKGEKLSLLEALEFLGKLEDPGALIRDKTIEKEALQRCKGYPEKKREMEHFSIVRVPRTIAAVLINIPESVAAAVDAFYIRDPVSLKCLSRPSEKRRFPSHDWVRMSVRFSKVLYAQLRGQQWNVPRNAGFPPIPGEGTETGKEVDIGVKLTAGFEMLLAKENRKLFPSPGIQRIITQVEDLINRDDAYRKYLPTDEELARRGMKNDSEDWLNIDFTEFEKDLNRASGGPAPASTSTSGEGPYSDLHAQQKMQLLVERFEKFLGDEKAGLEGAELGSDDEELNSDDDDDDPDDISEISFDEEEFSRLMREMMGMPPDQPLDSDLPPAEQYTNKGDDEEEEEEEEAEILKMQEAIGAELRAAGIIDNNTSSSSSNLDSGPRNTGSKEKGKARITDVTQEEEEIESDIDDREEVEVDFELVKNMLESFKGQGGLAGPAGTLLAEMGIYLPRDEDEGSSGGDGSRGGGAVGGGR